MNIHTINASTDQEFLKEKRKDPVTQQLLKPGDRVVVCANEKIVFLESVWNDSCPLCGCSNTLDHLPVRSNFNYRRHHNSQTSNNRSFTITRTRQAETTENSGCLGSLVYSVIFIILLVVLFF